MKSSAPPTTQRSARRFDSWAALCMAVYVVLGLSLVARVPLLQAPDEAAHFEYVQHIATLRSLPVFAGAAPPAPGYEFHQPPLYYILAAPFWAATGAGVQNYSARLVSLLCGALAVWLVLAASRAIFGPDERGERMARRAAMLAALWPLHIAIGSSANNDALGGLCAAALFWRLALLSKRAPGVRDGVWIGALCGLGLLAKSTTLTVSLASMLALWMLSRRASQVLVAGSGAEESPQVLAAEPGKVLGAGVGASLVVCGWMLARNTMMYGDALAYGAFKKAADAIGPGFAEFSAGLGMSFSEYASKLLTVLFCTCWGFFGGPNTAIKSLGMFARQPAGFGLWLGIAGLILLAASTWTLVRGAILGARLQQRLGGSSSSRDVVLLWWGVAVALVVVAWAQFALAHFAGGQARYLHAALVPACVLASRAWDDVPRAARAPLSWAVALLLLALTLANAQVWRTLT